MTCSGASSPPSGESMLLSPPLFPVQGRCHSPLLPPVVHCICMSYDQKHKQTNTPAHLQNKSRQKDVSTDMYFHGNRHPWPSCINAAFSNSVESVRGRGPLMVPLRTGFLPVLTLSFSFLYCIYRILFGASIQRKIITATVDKILENSIDL